MTPSTITILKLEPGQKIPRPFNRANSVEEAAEMLAYWQSCLNTTDVFARRRFAEFARKATGAFFNLGNLNTEHPVFEHAGRKFYAFTEE